MDLSRDYQLQGEVFGAAPSLAVTEMEVELSLLQIGIIPMEWLVFYSGGQHQHDIHGAWPLDTLMIFI